MVNFSGSWTSQDSEICKEVECPICLGIVREAQVCVECMHRFCKECIETSMNNTDLQCPSCCICFPNHHSLKDDKLVDAFIAFLYPGDDKYQKEELILTETEQINIQQGQASYMQTLKRQAKVDSGKRMSTNFVIRRDPTGQCIFRPIPFKGMRKVRKHVDDDEGWSGGSKKVKVRRLTSSSGDGDSLSYPFENETTIRNREKDRLMLEIFGPESTDDSDESGTEEEFMETNLMSLVSLQWGKRGKRSMRKGTWKRHILENHVGQHKNTQDEMGIQVLLVSMDASVIPNLQNPQVSCKPNVTLKSLCEMYVAPYVEAQAEKIEMYVVKELVAELTMIDPHRDRVEIVNKEDSVGGLRMYNFNNGYVIIGYMKTP